MAAIERYKSCLKCGHVNEHRLEWHQFMGDDGFMIVTCTVCGYQHSEKPADTEAPKPEVSDARLRLEFNTWRLGNPSEFETWLRKQIRLQGGNGFGIRH
jgi:hypothetical protein